MLRVQILEGATTTYFKEQQTKFLGGANQFLGGGGGNSKQVIHLKSNMLRQAVNNIYNAH